MTADFRPGDVIERVFQNGSVHRWTVQDPVRTRAGKLRVKGESATTVLTTWWRPDSLPSYPPRVYRYVPREEA